MYPVIAIRYVEARLVVLCANLLYRLLMTAFT